MVFTEGKMSPCVPGGVAACGGSEQSWELVCLGMRATT